VSPEAHVAAICAPVTTGVYVPIPTLPHALTGRSMNHRPALSLQLLYVGLLCSHLHNAFHAGSVQIVHLCWPGDCYQSTVRSCFSVQY